MSLLAWDRGREHDLNFSRKAGDVPAGSLYLADLGFWCPERLDHFTKQGVFWVSRVPAGATLITGRGPRESLVKFLARQKADRVDQWVLLGEKKFAFRLVAVRCPKSVAAKKKPQAHQKVEETRAKSQRQTIDALRMAGARHESFARGILGGGTVDVVPRSVANRVGV